MNDSINRGPVDAGTAASVVNDNLGLDLSADDLGMDREDPFAGIDLGDDLDPNTGDLLDGDNELDISFGDPPQQQQQQQPNNQQQQQNQQQRQTQPQQQPSHRPLPKQSVVKPDRQGNLVDANGVVIAKAGSEARHYQKFEKYFEAPLREAATRIASMGQQQQQMQTNLNQAVEIGTGLVQKVRELSQQVQQGNEVARTYGLSQDELIQAATFARQAKASPVEAIKSILTTAVARGIDLKSVLGPNAQGAGIDTKAILDLVKNEIANAVKPINDRTAQEQQSAQQEQAFQQRVTEIQTEARSFFARTQEALPFLEAFRAIKTDPNLRHLSMEHIWSEIRLKLAERGLTPETYMQKQRQRQTPNGGTMPNGRQRATIAFDDNGSGTERNQMAPVSMSYEQIVRDLLKSQ